MPKPEKKSESPDIRDWPAYWLVKLDDAVRGGDFRAAAEAQSQLQRFGIDVRYGRSREVAHA
jgi:hypothetical protein